MTLAAKVLSSLPFTVQLLVNPVKPRDFMVRVTDEIAINVAMLECVYLAVGNENTDEQLNESIQSVIWSIHKSLKSLNEQITAHIRSDFKITAAT